LHAKTNRGYISPLRYIICLRSGFRFAGFPANGNPVVKPHSFSDIEAETAIAKPPNAHKRGRAHPWFAYFALFDNPVKSIPNTYLAQSFSIGNC